MNGRGGWRATGRRGGGEEAPGGGGGGVVVGAGMKGGLGNALAAAADGADRIGAWTVTRAGDSAMQLHGTADAAAGGGSAIRAAGGGSGIHGTGGGLAIYGAGGDSAIRGTGGGSGSAACG